MKPRALEWLLEENQPSIRYLILTQLLGKPEDDPDVKSAKETIAKKGWAANILAQHGSVVSEESEAKAYTFHPRETGSAQQNDNPQGIASAQTFELEQFLR
jgi:hypothetical protein